MYIYTCDRCGCEIKDNDFDYCIIDCDGNRIDLCEDCYEKLQKFLDGESVVRDTLTQMNVDRLVQSRDKWKIMYDKLLTKIVDIISTNDDDKKDDDEEDDNDVAPWVSVEDDLPNVWDEVIAKCSSGACYIAYLDRYGFWRTSESAEGKLNDVVAWLPIKNIRINGEVVV